MIAALLPDQSVCRTSGKPCCDASSAVNSPVVAGTEGAAEVIAEVILAGRTTDSTRNPVFGRVVEGGGLVVLP
ncbi:MAG UNVERIFIED_CONTAM: hypothetical protein LVR18_28835 [Planctomycetaceae bacterium]